MFSWYRRYCARRIARKKNEAARLFAYARLVAVTGNYSRAIELLRQACAAHPEAGRTEYMETCFRELWKGMCLNAATHAKLLKKIQRAAPFVSELYWREHEELPPICDRDLAVLKTSLR